jgi:hypothetical protein
MIVHSFSPERIGFDSLAAVSVRHVEKALGCRLVLSEPPSYLAKYPEISDTSRRRILRKPQNLAEANPAKVKELRPGSRSS